MSKLPEQVLPSQRELQADYEVSLISSIFTRDLPTSGERSGKSAAPNAEKNKEIKAEQALNIYQNNFLENGIRALAITFPTVENLISPESFRVLAKHYLLHYEKSAFDWAEYGASMPEFIDEQDALADSPFLSECAELDWLIHRIQREADADFVAESFAKLEITELSALRFTPAPGLCIMPSWFPVVDLYQLVHDPYLQSKEAVLAREDLLKNINKSINNALNSAINSEPPRSLVVWRAEYKAQFEYVSDAEASVINHILSEEPVSQVIEAVVKHDLDLSEWLSEAIQKKRIFAVE
ncbi:putative DNA-binding domain-containing protein [Glaciecola sp. MH2013]|uniref:HvfC/BufC N-terminal domain-containing protein n=1 Tax=Glaciecola sp. MH2013 TaxID=2785524 RepID=UPI0018A03059|nr:DNA-binding domain-containing protein [Glaciecola sp. MH2013]MBF7072122.1 putative DNA-binding domain-containing protein [Glaciecola sp. MH2013]